MNAPLELDAARSAIAQTDREIIALIARRLTLAMAVGAAKEERGLPVCDPAREAAVLREAASAARIAGLDEEEVRQVFWCLVAMCRRAQHAGQA